MPRIHQNWEKYYTAQMTRWVKDNLVRLKMKQKELAELMDIGERNMGLKINAGRFTNVEMAMMFDIFGTPDEERARVMTPEVSI